jgi:hypothetical protein
MSSFSSMTGEFTVSAVLVDCEIVRKRKDEIQSSSPADLAKMLGQDAFDESLASIPLKDVLARYSREQELTSDGSQPLVRAGHEALAQFLTTPRSMREFLNIRCLARHFEVRERTIRNWARRGDVLQRAMWLSRGNLLLAILIARRELPGGVERMAQDAKAGSIQAAKFLLKFTGPKDR